MANSNATGYDRLVDGEVIPVNDYGSTPMMCRICFDEGDDRDEFIVPCLCAGGNKYIHKACLDRWRATNQNPRAFTNCPTCGFEYHIEEIVQERPVEGTVCGCVPARKCSRKSRFRLMVSRDFLVGFFLVQAWLIPLAVIIRLIDQHEKLVEWFPVDNADRAGLENALYHHKATYYCAAILVTFFLTGVYACCFSNERICNDNGRRLDPCPGCHGNFCFIGDCDCCVGGGDAGAECAAVMLVIVAIIVIIFIFVGIFFGIMAITAWIQRVLQRHVHILHKKELAREFVVVDLEKAGRLRYAAPENAPAPNAPSEIQISSPEFAQASAPPPEHFQASRNLNEVLNSPSWW